MSFFGFFLDFVRLQIMEDTSYVECSTLEIKEKGKKFLVFRVYVGSVDENFGLHYSVE